MRKRRMSRWSTAGLKGPRLLRRSAVIQMGRGTGLDRYALCGSGACRAGGDRDAQQAAVGGGEGTVAGDQAASTPVVTSRRSSNRLPAYGEGSPEKVHSC